MVVFFSFFVFALGLVVGSFLNAVIWRLAKGESALEGRSYCPHCRRQLAWQDLVPVASFVFLRGKCRYCRKRISWQYPLVEISTALIFLLIFKSQTSSLNQVSSLEVLSFVYLWMIASLLIVLFVYDLKHYILPDIILYPAIGLAFIYNLGFWILNLFGNWKLEIGISAPLIQTLFAAIGASGFFFLVFFASRGAAMGFGDVKLAFFMGLFLGWPDVVTALFCAFFSGAAIGLALIALRKKSFKSEVPFGPFLIFGTFAAFFWGEALVDWYETLLLL